MTTLEDFARELSCGRRGCPCGQVRRGKVTTHCPAHRDVNRPSFDVVESGNGRLLWICRAGCSQTETTKALQDRELWVRRSVDEHRKQRLDYSARRTMRILTAAKAGELSWQAADWMLRGHQAEQQRRRAEWQDFGDAMIQRCRLFEQLGRNYDAVLPEVAT